MVSHIQDLKVVHHTNKAKLCFISLAPSVRNNNISINKPLNSLLTKSLEQMDSTTTTSLNPVVMAQKIQALTADVQELKKQNEDLKRRVRPMGTNTS